MGDEGRPGLTSHDVARLAGVSQSTVSRALRGDPRVTAATRVRVQQAATALGYVPSEVGRSLSTQLTKQIAMVADLENPLYPQLVGPVHDALLAEGFRLLVLAERREATNTAARLLDRSVDGAILTTTLLHSSLPFVLDERRLPFVLLNRASELTGADQVMADNVGGARAVADLLLRNGHRTIGALLGPSDASTSQEREAGLREGLAAAGVGIKPEHISRGDFQYQDGYAGFEQLMGQQGSPTALFCVNDMVAAGALNAARVLGRDVPGEVTIVGFDDLDLASWPNFRLTTVKVDLTQMAERAARLLVERLSVPPRGTSTRSEVFGVHLIERSTHGPAPS